MDNIGSILLTIFGGIITLAIVSVIVGKKSQAPQAIQAIGTALSGVVAAAVNPVSANYGYGNGGSSFSSPAGGLLSDLGGGFADGLSGSFPLSVIPGGSK